MSSELHETLSKMLAERESLGNQLSDMLLQIDNRTNDLEEKDRRLRALNHEYIKHTQLIDAYDLIQRQKNRLVREIDELEHKIAATKKEVEKYVGAQTPRGEGGEAAQTGHNKGS